MGSAAASAALVGARPTGPCVRRGRRTEATVAQAPSPTSSPASSGDVSSPNAGSGTGVPPVRIAQPTHGRDARATTVTGTNQRQSFRGTGKTGPQRYFIRRTVNEPGKFLFIFGLIIAGIGLLLWSGFGKDWLGRLPGDIHYTKGNFSFHFPIVTCLLISALLTILLWLFRK